MLKLRRSRKQTTAFPTPVLASEPLRSVAETNPDLKIRNLLDDPSLRAVLGLDDTIKRAA